MGGPAFSGDALWRELVYHSVPLFKVFVREPSRSELSGLFMVVVFGPCRPVVAACSGSVCFGGAESRTKSLQVGQSLAHKVFRWGRVSHRMSSG